MMRLLTFIKLASFVHLLCLSTASIHQATQGFPLPPLSGCGLKMDSESLQLMLNTTQSVEFVCQFHGNCFNLFDNPVVWYKHQLVVTRDLVINELQQINMMANVLEPFSSQLRFKATFNNTRPTYRFALSISALSRVDDGNYSCNVRGPHSSVLLSVTHQLIVTAPVERLLITDVTSSNDVTEHRSVLVFVVGRASKARCVAVGGNTAAVLLLTVGNKTTEQWLPLHTLTDDLQSEVITSSRGEPGLRTQQHWSQQTVSTQWVTAGHDGLQLRCQANNPRFTASIYTTIVVYYLSVVECHATKAFIGQRFVSVSCQLKSQPPVTYLHWTIDDDGTTVHVGQVTNEYWTIYLDRSNGLLEVQLYIRQVKAESFREYRLHVENEVASVQAAVVLSRNINVTSSVVQQRTTLSTFHNLSTFDFHQSSSTSSRIIVFIYCRTVEQYLLIMSVVVSNIVCR